MEVLESDHFYHIYNRGNGKVNIFKSENNYLFFLQLLRNHINPIGEIYAYCLLPNHFHFLIRIKEGIPKPSQAFSNMFNAYSKAFNKEHKRVGSLFQRPFKRIKVTEENYLKSLIIYIHCNPELHGITAKFSRYSFSSYQSILSTGATSLMRNEVIKLFEDVENFEFAHKKKVHDEVNKELILE